MNKLRDTSKMREHGMIITHTRELIQQDIIHTRERLIGHSDTQEFRAPEHYSNNKIGQEKPSTTAKNSVYQTSANILA